MPSCSQLWLLDTILSDVRFTTGSNMRRIMLMAENTIEELEMGGVDIKYHDILESEVWRSSGFEIWRA